MVRLRFWGKEALFCAPHFRADPYSWPFPTPSSTKGMIRSIYWKPEFEWEIRRIFIRSRICYYTTQASAIKDPRGTRSTLTTSTLLTNVDYVVDAEIVLNPYAKSRKGLSEYVGEAHKRLRRGEQYRQPYFGRREYASMWMPFEGDPEPLPITLDPGPMLFDLRPINIERDQWSPLWFRPQLVNGVVGIPRSLYDAERDHLMHERARTHKRGDYAAA